MGDSNWWNSLDDDHDYGAFHRQLSSLVGDTSCHIQCHINDIVIIRCVAQAKLEKDTDPFRLRGQCRRQAHHHLRRKATPVVLIPDATGREAHPLDNVILPLVSVPDATGGGGAAASEPAEPPAAPQVDPDQSPEEPVPEEEAAAGRHTTARTGILLTYFSGQCAQEK